MFQITFKNLIIRLEARCARTVLTLSDITPRKVNRLDEIWSTLSKLSGTGPGRFWGAICAEARVGERGKICFFF